jgi:hypothetical protein
MAAAIAVAHDVQSSCGEGAVLQLRAVLVMVPPLLADLIRQVVASRAENLGVALSIIGEFDDSRDIDARLDLLAPDLVIFGTEVAASSAAPAAAAPERRLLTLSSDLAWVLGPNEGDVVPLTPDSLAHLLGDILQSI